MKGLSKGRYDETFAGEDDPLSDRWLWFIYFVISELVFLI